ncbi:DUF3617 family protein [Novosphingobium sp.]|uniref:DUF3617 family protein n=1 Tax=Novosphingobium sp. TaxID=1874826 RepID=UPI0025DAD6E5|nr:DUF3617 family protein [Novosphingobium sp.]MCC6926406.1 DUF3617 family protein [Novosphingobium sp.]
MPAYPKLLAALTVAGIALIPVSATAQQSKEAAKRDVTAWGQSISQAFGPGYWEGEMKEYDAAGNVVKTENNPDCIKEGESSKLGTSLGEMFNMIVDMADCTTTSGGPGSLNLKLECLAPGNKRMTFNSFGTYGTDQVNWGIDFKAEGEGAPESRSMKVVARRVKNTC